MRVDSSARWPIRSAIVFRPAPLTGKGKRARQEGDGKRKRNRGTTGGVEAKLRSQRPRKFLVVVKDRCCPADSSEQLLIGALEQKLVGIAGGHCHPDLARRDADLRADLEQS